MRIAAWLLLAGALAMLANTFAELPEGAQMIVLSFLAMAAAAGPLLIVGGSLIKNFTLMSTTLAKHPALVKCYIGPQILGGTNEA